MLKSAALLRASLMLLLACLTVSAWATACDPKGGVVNIGAELSAVQGYPDGTFLYNSAQLICQGGVVTTLSGAFSIISSAKLTVDEFKKTGSDIHVYGSSCGNHIIGVSRHYRGTVGGDDFSIIPFPKSIAGVFYFPPATPECPSQSASNSDLGLGTLGENGRPCDGGCGSPSVGDPINTSSGNVYNPVQDMAAAQSEGVFIQRHYNSMLVSRPGAIGSGWTGNYLQSLLLNISTAYCPPLPLPGLTIWNDPTAGGAATVADIFLPTPSKPAAGGTGGGSSSCPPPPPQAIALRPTGRGVFFDMASGGKDINGLNYFLTILPVGYTLRTPEDSVESYDSKGVLQSISYRSGRSVTLTYNANKQLTSAQDSYGRTLSYQYNARGLISQITDPAGKAYAYTYDSNNNLVSAGYPDNTSVSYQYEIGALPNLLTGEIDQKGIRYATWTYDSSGRAISSEHASGGIDKTTVNYSNPATPIVGTPLGVTQTQTLVQHRGIYHIGSLQQQCNGCPSKPLLYNYDSNGNLSGITNWRGIQTTMQYDLTRNLETSRTEAVGTPQARTITTVWHPSFRLPTLVTEPGRSTAYTYDSRGNMLTLTVTDTSSNNSRTWTYTYNALSQPLTVQDPLGRTTQLSYDATGNLNSLRNALGQTTIYDQYTALGQVGRITDANGRITTLTYDARSRLLTSTTGSEATAFGYDAIGNLVSASLPSGVALSYSYDNAHRLIGISDSLGNAISYTLDAAGNRTREVSSDATGQLASNMAVAAKQRSTAPILPAPPASTVAPKY